MITINQNPSFLSSGNIQVKRSLHDKAKTGVLLMLKNQSEKILVQRDRMTERQNEIKALTSLLNHIEKMKSEKKDILIYKDGVASENKPISTVYSGSDRGLFSGKLLAFDPSTKEALSKLKLLDQLSEAEMASRGLALEISKIDDQWIEKVKKALMEHSQPIEKEQILLKETISQYDKIDRLGIKLLKMSHDMAMSVIRNISL